MHGCIKTYIHQYIFLTSAPFLEDMVSVLFSLSSLAAAAFLPKSKSNRARRKVSCRMHKAGTCRNSQKRAQVSQCSTMLKGFWLMVPKEVYYKFDPSCVTLSILLAHGLDADVVAYIPLPSLAVWTKAFTSRFMADSRKYRLEEASMRTASNMLSVQTTRSQGKKWCHVRWTWLWNSVTHNTM